MNVGNFSVNTSIGAGATVNNVLEGLQFRFLGNDARVTIAAIGAGATYAYGELSATVYVGSTLLLQNGAVPIDSNDQSATLINGSPRLPDHIIADGVGAAGNEITIQVVNADGGGAHDFRAIVRVTPV